MVFVVVAIIGAVVGYSQYSSYKTDLEPVDHNNPQTEIFIVEKGDTFSAVATKLEDQGLIRSADAMRWYLRFEAENDLKLQVGAFELNSGQSVEEILSSLVEGKVLQKKLTIVPASTIFDVEAAIVAAGYSEAEAQQALALDYSDHPAFADAPEDATLEGYLYPDTYLAGHLQPPQALLGLALDETAKVLQDPAIRAGIESQGLTLHEAIILASIIEQEVSSASGDRPQVAQVFLRRLEIGMPLGADPTFRYASQLAGVADSVSIDSPYNTRIYAGLPPGPIGAISRSSLQAIADPAEGDFLYFVAGDDGNTYFNRTFQEHQADVDQYCIELCKL